MTVVVEVDERCVTGLDGRHVGAVTCRCECDSAECVTAEVDVVHVTSDLHSAPVGVEGCEFLWGRAVDQLVALIERGIGKETGARTRSATSISLWM